MQLYKHQVKYAKGYKDKAFIVHEGGTGKTICACAWLKDGRDDDALVICPKRIVRKWQETLKEMGTKATVLSKENFKKSPPKCWSAVVVDEADEFASPLLVKGRSQLATALYTLVKKYPSMPVMLCTATPIRSNPWNLHTLLCYLGIYMDKNAWRSHFFNLEKRPFLRQMAWFPKNDWRQRIRPALVQYADIVLLKDCIGNLPSIAEKTLETPYKVFERPLEVEPTALFVAEHRWEQKNKVKKILEIGKEYRKVLVVAHYVEQVESLAQELGKDRQTYMVHGGIKDQEAILKEANEVDECYLVIQASLGAGFDADSFSCVIFASMSYRVRDFVQMKYRVRRIHNLHPVEYNYLIGGRCDKAVYKTIMLGRDFVPSEWQ
jgi:superfamily II DNA or RNA helicase